MIGGWIGVKQHGRWVGFGNVFAVDGEMQSDGGVASIGCGSIPGVGARCGVGVALPSIAVGGGGYDGVG